MCLSLRFKFSWGQKQSKWGLALDWPGSEKVLVHLLSLLIDSRTGIGGNSLKGLLLSEVSWESQPTQAGRAESHVERDTVGEARSPRGLSLGKAFDYLCCAGDAVSTVLGWLPLQSRKWNDHLEVTCHLGCSKSQLMRRHRPPAL